MSFLGEVCAALRERDVRYAIVGGHAVALHGALRGTVDIDIAIDWDEATLEQAVAGLTALGLESRLPVTVSDVYQYRDEYIRNRNLVGWNFFDPGDPTRQVDIVIAYDLSGKERVRFETADGPVYVLSRRDLVSMKKASGRPQDLEDADALERLS